jgi:hypothetical protein
MEGEPVDTTVAVRVAVALYEIEVVPEMETDVTVPDEEETVDELDAVEDEPEAEAEESSLSASTTHDAKQTAIKINVSNLLMLFIIFPR